MTLIRMNRGMCMPVKNTISSTKKGKTAKAESGEGLTKQINGTEHLPTPKRVEENKAKMNSVINKLQNLEVGKKRKNIRFSI